MLPDDRFRRLDTVHPRHPQIHEYHVRIEILYRDQRSKSVHRVTNDLKTTIALEHAG